MAERKSNTLEATGDRTLVITRVFDAPRPLVFAAWTKKEHLDRWCAPHGFVTESSGADFRVGGRWHSCMIRPDGEKFPVSGVYREIVENELLVFTHTWEPDPGEAEHETVVTVRFADEGHKTRITFEQSIFKSVESRDGHNGGWTQCFERLDGLLTELAEGK